MAKPKAALTRLDKPTGKAAFGAAMGCRAMANPVGHFAGRALRDRVA